MPQAAAAVLMLVAAAAAAGPAADVSAVNAWVDATKQDAGLIRQLVTSGKTAAASSKLDEIVSRATAFKASLSPKSSVPGGVETLTFDTGASFEMSTTHEPKRCSRRADRGHRVRIHYIGKLLKTGKTFTSSFHTGSVPYRMVVGDPKELAAWNRGLVGACPDERRRIVAPWNDAYGKDGDTKLGVPHKADVEFFVEVVSVSERPVQRQPDEL